MAEVRSQFVAALVVLIVCAGCAFGRYGPSANTRSSPAPRAIDRLTVDERRAVLRRAHVWRPIDTRSLNILAGPRANDAFTHDQLVPCDYDYPDKPLSGMSPKFECAVSRGDVVKVKYGPDNGEVYAEVAATRLFWALGFAADRMYPVRVICRKCPADPFKESKTEWHLGKTPLVSDQTFNPATIERPLAGEEVEVPGYEGWAWPELEYVSEETGGAPRSHIDALELLAVFIQHVDSKPEQQAIKCAPQNIRRDRSGNATCSAPLLVVKDLGSSFGAARRFNFKKMDLASWREVPIWRDPAACTGHLTRSIIGSLSNPPISEAGRQFLADQLMLLSDQQIRDLFVAARVEQRGETIRDATGDTRAVTVEDWVDAFKEKRAQIVDHRCPA